MGGDIPAAFPVPGSLLLATGVRGGNGASPNDPSVSIIDDVDALLAFLGRINTPNEAALVLSAHRGSAFQCILRRDGDDYTVSAIDYSGGLCPPTQQNIELRVTPDGAYSETPLGPPYLGTGCVGRRPDGLCATLLTGGDETPGDWLARTARLEAAAVAAFVLLAHELEALGAPRELLARLKRAARDEIAHTEQLTALARARGAEPAPAIVIPQLRRSPLELALENAVEGCVRECWGALCARFQAAAAQAPDVRAVFDGIAREEAEHAQLSRDIGAWLDAHLGPRDRACVAAARDQAIGDLRRELERDLAAPTRSELGLPSRAQALAALDALEGRGLLRAA
jgi:rubrerythrin